jgi:Ca2+-binding RTX toxin-like protein
MARIREIDLDPTLDAPASEAPLLRGPAAGTIDTANTPVALVNPALADVRADLSDAVLAPAPAAPTVIDGTPGNDSIWGTEGVDHIRGLGGDDFISAGGGDDVVTAGAGNDMVFGGEGHDKISGNDGDDLLRGNGGNDKLYGMGGNDLLEGAEGDDALDGGDGLDALFGGFGNDVLRGGSYSDTLDGGYGKDRLEGGKGRDTLTGGAERDTFVADLNGDTWSNHHYQPDVITDFTTTLGWHRDCLDLRIILDKTTFTGSTMQQALDQGYVRFAEYTNYDGSYGTWVIVDPTGHATDPHGTGALRAVALENVHAVDLDLSTTLPLFLV